MRWFDNSLINIGAEQVDNLVYQMRVDETIQRELSNQTQILRDIRDSNLHQNLDIGTGLFSLVFPY